MAAVAAVEINGMAGQQTAHHGGNRIAAGAQQQMKMVGDQCPGKAAGAGLLQDLAQPVDKIATILNIFENFSTLNAPCNNMVQGSRGVYARLSRHRKVFTW